jgi:hypothetical protein
VPSGKITSLLTRAARRRFRRRPRRFRRLEAFDEQRAEGAQEGMDQRLRDEFALGDEAVGRAGGKAAQSTRASK